MQNDEDDDRVGYGRPPKHSRFKPGESGNPRGRPKGARGLSELIAKELNSSVTVIENGRRTKIKRRVALAKRLVGDALVGKKSSIDHVMMADRQVMETLRKIATALASEQDDLTRASFARRIQLMVDRGGSYSNEEPVE